MSSLSAGAPCPRFDAVRFPAPRSLRGLDSLCFFLADVADGLGPFLVIFLTVSHKWSSAAAGNALACLLVGTVASQGIIGAWLDQTTRKRWIVAAASIVVAALTVLTYLAPSATTVYATQFLTGVAISVFPPAIAALSLGLVGRERLDGRAGRNEAFNHAGNVVAAVVAIAATSMLGSGGPFFAVALMAAASAVAVLMIRETDINHCLARGGDGDDQQLHVAGIGSLLTDRRLLWFMASVILFHFANAAMLPLVGQKAGRAHADTAPATMAWCIIVAQLVMVPMALITSRIAARHGRKGIFLFGFAVLPIRGLLYTATDRPSLLILIQVLDGVAAGIYGVAGLLTIADLTRGTGRFNLVQGVLATCVGLGAALSNALTGVIADRMGFDAAFLFLAGVAVIATAIYAIQAPETLGTRRDNSSAELTPTLVAMS